MILVINLNASVDKRYELQDIKKGAVMRAKTVENTPGGKGIHVANVATILKEDCLVTGFLGGKTGEFIKDKLKCYNIKNDFVDIKEDTRECLAFTTDDLIQTEILEPGPNVTEDERESFFNKYNSLIDKSTIVVASGSVPRNIEDSFYKELIKIANAKGKKFLLDGVPANIVYKSCGFSDYACFYRAFKKKYGFSPSKLKKIHNEYMNIE